MRKVQNSDTACTNRENINETCYQKVNNNTHDTITWMNTTRTNEGQRTMDTKSRIAFADR